MSTKLISINQIINRVKRHPMLSKLPTETIIDYSVEFFRIVGLPTAFIEKTCIVHIDKYKAALPTDLIEINQVRTLGPNPKYLRYTTDSFHLSPNKTDSAPFTYKVQGHFIYVTVPFTDLEISYQAIPVDECGLLLLPDNAKFIRALENYIKLQHFTILCEQGKLDPRILDRVDREYCWAVGACESDFHSISTDQAESILNMASSMLIRGSEHHRGYATAGNKELIRIQ